MVKRWSNTTVTVLGVIASYVGLQGYDYYRLREEKRCAFRLLDERVARRRMDVVDDLRHVRVVVARDGKEAFYDYARDFFKYLDCDIQEMASTPGQAYAYFKEHLGDDSEGIVVVGRHLLDELIDAYNDGFPFRGQSNVSTSVTRDTSVVANTTGRFRRILRFFQQSPSRRSARESLEAVTSASETRLPILGYLPLVRDDPDRPWYASMRDHFYDRFQARIMAKAALIVAEGSHVDISQSAPSVSPLSLDASPLPVFSIEDQLLRRRQPDQLVAASPSSSDSDSAPSVSLQPRDLPPLRIYTPNSSLSQALGLF